MKETGRIFLGILFLGAFFVSLEPVRSESFGSGTRAGEKKTLTVNGVDFTFCWCPAGEFEMGSPKSEEGRGSGERRHHVTLTQGFWLLESEVTQGMWSSVMGTTVAAQAQKATWTTDLRGVGAEYPMYYESWEEASEFCRKLGGLSGEKIVLPTESQWEYACRAGTAGAYGGTGGLAEMGWYRDNSDRTTHAVKGKNPNAWGLYDMHGNVWEWCSDWYAEDYPTGSVTDPAGPSSGSGRVYRGGGWSSLAGICRSAIRDWSFPGRRFISLGFRPALVPEL